MTTTLSSLASSLLVPLRPLRETVGSYSISKLRGDAAAGLTVAIVAIPQAMAFALIANVPPIYGLYGVIVQAAVGALLTSSNHLSMGPTNTMSLLVAAVAGRMMNPEGDIDSYLVLTTGLALISGLIQLAFAAARMGALFKYVSHSVIVGFTAGAGLLIIAKQVPNFLGVELVHLGPEDVHLPGLPGTIQQMLPHMAEPNWRAMLIGGSSLAVMVGAKMLWKKLPAALLAVATGTVMVVVGGWTEAQVDLVGALPRALPDFTPPSLSFNQAQAMLGGALAIALVGTLEAVAIGKSIGLRTGERVNPTQEFFAQGFTNTLSSVFGCYPGTGSFSRSALNFAAGARTRFSGLFTSGFVAVALLALAPFGRYLPLASLAAILFVIAYGLIDWRYFLRVGRTGKADLAVCLATLGATLLFHLEYAIFIGIFLNIAIYLRKSSRLRIAEMVRSSAGGPFLERPLRERRGERQVMFLQIEGPLFFGNADELHDRLASLERSGVRIVIFRLKRTHMIDATVLSVFDDFIKQFQARRGHVIFCGLRQDLVQRLRSFGIVDLVGQGNVFETDTGVFTSAKRALQRARELLGSSIDAEGLDLSDEPDDQAWSYSI